MTAASALALDGHSLTLADVVRVARSRQPVALSAASIERMGAARAVVERVLERGDLAYGLTTAVGVRKGVRVEAGASALFNARLIADHRVASGPDASEEVVRATLVRLANGLAAGTAGVRPALAERVVALLNANELPRVRLLGSVGMGDLAPMADVATRLADGFPLAAREGVALLASNAFSTALAALALDRCDRYLRLQARLGALELEALCANVTMLHPAIAEVRPYPGIARVLDRLRAALAGSFLWQPGAARSLQDPLSFRGLPQILGAADDAVSFALAQLAIELNASYDNPLVLITEDRVISTGNYDVLPLAQALDVARLALGPVISSANERTIKLMQSPHSGLSDGLESGPGFGCALSEYVWAAQALSTEARLLVAPVSPALASASGAQGIEDRVTMAPLAARRLDEMLELAGSLAAIQLVVAAQAVELRGSAPLGAKTAELVSLAREHVPFLTDEASIEPDLGPLAAALLG